jgi:hypothetical protein
MVKPLLKETKQLTKRKSRKAIQTVVAIQSNKTLTDASKQLGITRAALYDRIKRYGLNEIINDMKDQAQSTIDIASPLIAEQLVDLATSNKRADKTKVQISQDLLDRAGVTRKEPSSQVNIASSDMSIEFISL